MEQRGREGDAWVWVAAGCSLRCTFCPRSEGRSGLPLDEVLAGPLPRAHVVTIGAGDVLGPSLAPLVRRLRQEGADEVLVYAHPGCDPDALGVLAEAGLTGLHLVLPAAERKAMACLTGGRGSLARAARLMDCASHLGLGVRLEVPVVASTVAWLPDTVARALVRLARPMSVELAFGAEAAGGVPAPWDYRDAAGPLARVVALGRGKGVPVRLADPSAPPPCLVDLPDALGVHRGIDRPARPGSRPFAACAACEVRDACGADLRGFAARDDLPPPAPVLRGAVPGDRADPAAPASSAELFFRRADLDALVAALARLDRCPAPWDSLEAHDRTGRVAPCEGRWPQPAALEACGDWRDMSLLGAWNSEGMRGIRRDLAAGRKDRSCRRECPEWGRTWAGEPPLPLPRGRAFGANLLLGLREMLDGADELRSRPRHLTLSPTLRCNQRCRMCDLRDPAPDCAAGTAWADLPDALFDELVDLLPTTATLAFTGGEPLLSRRARDILAMLDGDRYPDCSVTITTNGQLLTARFLDDLARVNLERVYVSLNAATEATHEVVTGTPGTFRKVMENVARLAGRRSAMRGRPDVVLSFVVMRSTLAELPAFLDLAEGLGVGVRLLPVERDREGESLFTDPRELARTLATVVEARARPRPGGTVAQLDRLERVVRYRLQSGILEPL